MAIALNRPVATLDEFLEDPTVAVELEDVLERLARDERFGDFSSGIVYTDVRVKARPYHGASKRERLDARDTARLILRAWREHRP